MKKKKTLNAAVDMQTEIKYPKQMESNYCDHSDYSKKERRHLY